MNTFGDDFGVDVDPAAEFLAREQNDLAGIVDDFIPEMPLTHVQPTHDDFLMSAPSTNEPAPVYDDFGFDSEPQVNGSMEENLSFEAVIQSSHDLGQEHAIIEDDFEEVLGSANTVAPVPTPRGISPSLFSQAPPREEPEKIRKWREEYQKKLEEKDKEEERKIKELKDQAKRELDEWYKHHDEIMGKTKSANREASMIAEKELVADVNGVSTPGQEWERIAKLCDFNPKASRNSKDISRMRSIVLQLKQHPPVKNL